jgi:predicted ribosomally synthesized peptide with SipW-like signal peptide
MRRDSVNAPTELVGTKLALTAVVAVALFGVLGGIGTWAAFSSTTENPASSFTTGTVEIGDDDSDVALLSLQDARPGDTDVACIVVTYTGTLPASVRLYGNTTGSGLDAYLDLTVTRGTSTTPGSCAGFVPDPLNYMGAGLGVVYSGTLQNFQDSYDAAPVDPLARAAEVWNTGESHAYKLAVTVRDDNAAQGLAATQAFIWEARNN